MDYKWDIRSFPKHAIAALIRGCCLDESGKMHVHIYICPSNARPAGHNRCMRRYDTWHKASRSVVRQLPHQQLVTARTAPRAKKKNVNEQAFISKHATGLKTKKSPHVNMVTALFGTVLSRLTDRPLYSPTQPSFSINLLVVFMIPFHGLIIPSDDTSDNGRRCVCSRVRITS